MFEVELVHGVPEVKAENLKKYLGQVLLIDVRRPEEFTGELGHIENAHLVTLGPDLQNFLEQNELKEKDIVFVCRSGARSAQATMYSQQLGFKKVYNLQGGILRWNELQLPILK